MLYVHDIVVDGVPGIVVHDVPDDLSSTWTDREQPPTVEETGPVAVVMTWVYVTGRVMQWRRDVKTSPRWRELIGARWPDQ